MTTEEDKAHWDLKYEQGLPSLTTPDPFFLSAFNQFAENRFPEGGAALDLAGGLGRHALWLASRSWQVTVIDISEVAISRLHKSATEHALTLNLFVLDATEYAYQPCRLDLILLFYHINRELCPKVLSALKPGGILICKSGLWWNSDGESYLPFSADSVGRNEMPSLFPGLQTLYHLERPVRNRGVVEYVGSKSGSSA